MKSVFNLGGYTLEITDDGRLESSSGRTGGSQAGSIGLQVESFDVNGAPLGSVMQVFVKPSQARAIASAMLSAATVAKA